MLRWSLHQGGSVTFGRLGEVTTADLERCAAHVAPRGSARAAADGLYALIRLWGATPHLPARSDPMPPRQASDLSDCLPDAAEANDFAEDIIAAWHDTSA